MKYTDFRPFAIYNYTRSKVLKWFYQGSFLVRSLNSAIVDNAGIILQTP